MLQIFREKVQGVVTWVIVSVIAIAFVAFGLTGYFSATGENTQIAAKVEGQKISWQAVDNLYQRLAQQYEGQIDPKTLKEQILMAMVQRIALVAHAKALGFQVGDEQVLLALAKIPVFQLEGKFSKEQYLKVLETASLTDAGVRQELSEDILVAQLEKGLAQSSFIAPSELQSLVALLEQKRDFGYMLLPAAALKKDVQISADELKNYYEAHKTQFIRPEQVVLEYVELSLPALAEQIKPSKEDMIAYYQEHKSSYTTPERVHAKHILVKTKEQIETLAQELKQGADFEGLAKKYSEDTGSAEKGGDLGWFMRGQMVPEFEQAVFELKKPGSISAPVQTQFGYHLIQVVEHKDSVARPFAEVQKVILEQLKREKAELLFAEKAEVFANMGTQVSSLEPIAKELGLTVQETEPFARVAAADAKGMAGHPEVLKIAFEEALLKQGRNSDPIKLSDTQTAIFRLKKHEPAVQETLAQAEPRIKEQLTQTALAEKTKTRSETLVEKIQAGEKPGVLAQQQHLQWIVKSNVQRASQDIDRQILMAAFYITPNNKVRNSVQAFPLPNGDYLIMALNKVIPGDWSALTAEKQAYYREGLSDVALEYALYRAHVMQDSKIEILNEPKP